MEDQKYEHEDCEGESEEACQADINLQECHLAELTPMLFYVLNKVFDSKRDGGDHLYQLKQQVVHKSSLVTLANTTADPWAVVIVGGHAVIA